MNLCLQDICGLDYGGDAHLKLGKLYKIMPRDLRGKVICIHHNELIYIENNSSNVDKVGNSLGGYHYNNYPERKIDRSIEKS